MPGENEDGLDYRSAAIPILRAIQCQLDAVRLLLRATDAGEADDLSDHEAAVRIASLARDELTPREREVLTLLTRGASNGAIARTLGISVRTVKAHLGSIFGKLDVAGRSEAIVRVLSEGEADQA